MYMEFYRRHVVLLWQINCNKTITKSQHKEPSFGLVTVTNLIQGHPVTITLKVVTGILHVTDQWYLGNTFLTQPQTTK